MVAGVADSEAHNDNMEIWRQGMIERLKIENRSVGYWGGKRSGSFLILIGDSASTAVRIAAGKKLSFEEKLDFLHKELIKYYDKEK